MHSYTDRILIIAAALLLALILLYNYVLNPFNIFVKKSSRFTIEKFNDISIGTNVSEAIAILGEPIAINNLSEFSDCDQCIAYYFLGEAPDWLFSFNEAWLVADAEGRVVRRMFYKEP